MKKFKKLSAIVASMLLLVSISLIQSCKDKENPSPAAKPEITSISPAKAKVGATITITGKNFKAGTEGVSVKVEGVAATVTSATLTSIVCVVPEVAVGPADVVVSINTIASVAYNSFEVLEGNVNAPEITSISPTTALPGASVTITGLYFKEGITGVSVTFADTEATLTSATTTSIVCTVPQITAGAADVIVTVDGQASAAFTGFTVEKGISISDFEPKRGRFDTIITLTGEKFGTDKAAVKVTVNGKVQEITEITDTQLKIKLAKKTWSGAVKVEKDGVIAAATQELEYIKSYRSEILMNNRAQYGMDFDENDNLYMAYANYGLLVFDGMVGVPDTILKEYHPVKVYFGADNKIYCGNEYNGITTYDRTTKIADTSLQIPISDNAYVANLTGDESGNLYVETRYAGLIYKVNTTTKKTTLVKDMGSYLFGILFYKNKLITCHDSGRELVSLNTDGTGLSTIIPKADGYLIRSNLKKGLHDELYTTSINKLIRLKGSLAEEVLTIDPTFTGGYGSIAINSKGDILVGSGSSQPVHIIYVE